MPKATDLQTGWLCIGQSGPTIDGRNIKPEWLTEAAESYDPKVYQAKIWVDHDKWASYGSVLELQTEEKDGVVKLFARLKPSRSLIYVNKVYEEKRHFSMELWPDFAKSGKYYLSGLAVTDVPASLGTDELQFSKRPDADTAVSYFIGAPVPDLRETETEEVAEKLFSKFVSFFSKPSKTEEDDEMPKEEFEALKQDMAEIKSTLAAFTPLLEKFKDEQAEAAQQQSPTVPAAPEANGDITELKSAMTTLAGQFKDLSERLEKAVPATSFGEQTRPAGEVDDLL